MLPVRSLRLLVSAAVLLALIGTRSSAGPVVPGFERFHTGEKADRAGGGRLLLGELGCAGCHDSGDSKQSRRQAPILDRVGERIRPAHLERFLADPHAVKPGTTMPALLASDPDRQQKAKALAHFLASTGPLQHERPDMKSIGKGRDLYQKVGCVACHGTRDARGLAGKVFPTSVPLGDLKDKYTLASLADFLKDPLHIRVSGRMPRLLNPAEAKEVANYLLQGIKTPLVGKGTTRYAYYEGSWDTLPDFARLTPRATGKTNGFELGVARRGNDYALVFEGYFLARGEGNHTFTISSDDGAKLYVDGKEVVNNDGIHPTTSKSGKVVLSKGIHEVKVSYFQGGGEAVLEATIQGPGLRRTSLGDVVAATREDLNKSTVIKGTDEDGFTLDPALVKTGKELFGSLGCAGCHQLNLGGKQVGQKLAAPALARLQGEKGCLAETPARGLPSFALAPRQRQAIVAALASPKVEQTPADQIREKFTALNCYACHQRDKIGGAEDDLNKFFLTTQPEMGDEGRLPPLLDGVGAKITPEYFKQLLDKGVHDRPYMHTRMPGFGLANVGNLVEVLARTDTLPAVPAVTFKEPVYRVKTAARQLVGGLALGCIKCHTFAGQKAEGVQGIDMTLMPKKLRRDWFHAYISEPQRIRPGTRMPASYIDGKSVLPDILDGTALTQIEAMWLYLQDGNKARMPVGIASNKHIPLIPAESAILYRNFIEGAGSRAIAVGYPEKASLAFDANDLRLALIWQGAFIDAGRHWTDRGVGFEGPLGDNVLRLPGGPTFAFLDKSDAPWPTSARVAGQKFKGYRLTPDERPTFLYEVGAVRVEDFPNASAGKQDPTLKRTFTLHATGPTEQFYFRAAVGDKIEPTGEGWFKVDGWKVRLQGADAARVRKAGGKMELIVPVTFKDGKATIVQEYVW